jgi:hypothetical protein
MSKPNHLVITIDIEPDSQAEALAIINGLDQAMQDCGYTPGATLDVDMQLCIE